MLSIVTANWNGAKYLNIFLKSLENQSFRDFTLYLIDNGSKDDSIAIVNGFSDKMRIRTIILNENIGFSGANNLGIREAMKDESSHIITFNNDLELDDECLQKIVDAIDTDTSNTGAYQILMINHYERSLIDAAGLEFNRYYDAHQIALKEDIRRLPDLSADIHGVCAGAAVYAKDALERIKTEKNEYFDERYFAYFEDVDLALRLMQKGFGSKLIKDAVVYHVHSGTSGSGTPFKEYYLSRNNLIYRRKNIPSKAYNKFRWRYGLQAMKNLARHLLKGRFDLFKAAFRGYLDFVRRNY